LFALLNIQVAGAAGTYSTTIMMEVDIIFEGDLQDALSGFYSVQRPRFQTGLLKLKGNVVHKKVRLFPRRKSK
jgi:hypothetical protein